MATNIPTQNTIPVTEARGKLGNLVNEVQKEQSFLLTKRGRPKAVLLDVNYWEKIMGKLSQLYQKTFIDPKLTKYLRDFSDKEIAQWLKEDQP